MLKLIAVGVACGAMAVAQQPSERAGLSPVPFDAVRIADEFWAPRQAVNAEATLAHNFEQCRVTGRIANFERAARGETGGFEGLYFNDSDVYKAMEGAAYILAQRPDPELERELDALIATIAAAQHEDGYLNSYFTIAKPGQRWTNLKDMHELYCAGHLIEAAIAHHQATGKRTLLDVAIRFADHIDALFGPDGRRDVPGHQEIELALFKLADVTGETRYGDLAAFFLEQRGRADGRALYGEYCQDLLPVRDHAEAVGHAVRAMYLYSAVADAVARTSDEGFLAAMDRVWEDLTTRKMYVTGGIGPSPHNEGFTVAYDLPNDTSYAETCAGIGLVFWAHRLGLLHRDARYIDVMERALYNGVPSGVSLDGRKFFYVNPLGSRGDKHRRDWYACACCPPNILRLFASIGSYVYAHDDDELFVNLFVNGSAKVRLPSGTVHLEQHTRYPWDGAVRIVVRPEKPGPFGLRLRIPGWSRDAALRVNGEPTPVRVERGYARIDRDWRPGDTVELTLPMPVERIESHPMVKPNLGRIALQRGPVVYCLEGVDNNGKVRNLAIPRDAEIVAEHRGDLLSGVTVLRGEAIASETEWDGRLYRPATERRVEFTAVPYCVWENREPGEMVVWVPESPSLAEPAPVAWQRPSASHCYSGDTLSALNDRIEPARSGDESIPRFTWWPRRGSTEWVQYDFDLARKVSGVEVYWFDDTAAGGRCGTPASWRLLYRDGDEWRPVPGATEFGTALDAFNRVAFEPVLTDGLRIEATFKPDTSAGVLEWRVLAAQPGPGGAGSSRAGDH